VISLLNYSGYGPDTSTGYVRHYRAPYRVPPWITHTFDRVLRKKSLAVFPVQRGAGDLISTLSSKSTLAVWRTSRRANLQGSLMLVGVRLNFLSLRSIIPCKTWQSSFGQWMESFADLNPSWARCQVSQEHWSPARPAVALYALSSCDYAWDLLVAQCKVGWRHHEKIMCGTLC
jgi:hypothetical protein